MSSDFHKFASYARRFSFATLISRFSGLFRDIAMAYTFGDHPAVASFMVAFRFSQFFRRIFGEGSLQSTFIPHYEALKLQSEKKASYFFRDLNLYLFFILLFLISGCALLLKTLGCFSAFADLKEIFSLTLWMLPSLLFVCLYALNGAALQCHGSFFLSAIAPIFCNLLWIVGCFALNNKEMSSSMVYFSLFVTCGFFMQWLFTTPKTWKTLHLKAADWLAIDRSVLKEDIRLLSKAFLLATLGIGATQINTTLDALFAHYASVQAPIYLWYAIRIEQLPLALFGIALVSAITPSLARHIKEKDFFAAEKLFLQTKSRLRFLMLFFTFALFALGLTGTSVLFLHGHFTKDGIIETVKCLYGYGIGLIPATLVLLYSAAFYALSDYKTPMRASLFTVAINVILNTVFVFGFALEGFSIAIATSISNWANYFYLKHKLKKKELFNLKEDQKDLFKTSVIGLCSFVTTLFFEHVLLNAGTVSVLLHRAVFLPSSLKEQCFNALLLSLCFMGSFLLFCLAFRHASALSFFKEHILFKLKKQPLNPSENPTLPKS